MNEAVRMERTRSATQSEPGVQSRISWHISRDSKLNALVTHGRQKASGSMRHFRVGQSAKKTQFRLRPAFRRTDETYRRFVQPARTNTRNAPPQSLGNFRIAHCAEQSLLVSRPRSRMFPALWNAQRMSFQLHRVSCPTEHPRHNCVGSLAEQLNLTRGPTNSLWRENGNAK